MNMATLIRLSSQDRKELDKFTKFLAFKAVQVIVQSRLGEKLKTKSKPFSSGADWFSVTIDDVPEVLRETKNALGGLLPTLGVSLCVEISLKTVEGDTMVLETWCLGMLDQCDTDARITYTVYNRMGILLKSLIAVTRVTPAYRLSCRQGPDSYVICYRVFMGEPQLHTLGEGYQQVRVGQVGTPTGTFVLNVAYRVKLTITPQRVERDCPFMVKSDHFKPDLSPKRPHKLWPYGDGKVSVVEEIAAAYDECQELGCTLLPNSPPNECNGIHSPLHHSPVVEKRSPQYERNGDCRLACGVDCQASFSESKKVGAFAGEPKKPDPATISEYLIPETAFSSLLHHEDDLNVKNKNLQHKRLQPDATTNNNNAVANGVEHSDFMDTHSENGSHESQKSTTSVASGATDDFVMVELKTPFATDVNNDLSSFYRECQAAPPLDAFKSNPTLAEQVSDLSNQLAAFEMNLHDFDELVDSLCSSEP